MRLDKFLVSEGIMDRGIMKAVFMAGHPGSGKSYVLDRIRSGNIEPRIVNTDKMFPLFKEWWHDNWPKVRGKVKSLTNNQLAGYLNSMLPLAVDGTGGKVSTLMRRKSLLESLGYDTMMIFVNTSLETALDRASKREREVKPEHIKKIYDDISKHKQYYRSKFDDFIEVDNDEGQLTDEVIQNVFKHATKFYSEPVENPIGKEHIEEMKENGWKYLDPNVVPMEKIKNMVSGWYKK